MRQAVSYACVNTAIVDTSGLKRALFNVVFDQLKGATRPPVTDIQELQRGDRNAASNFIPITGHFLPETGGGGLFSPSFVCLHVETLWRLLLCAKLLKELAELFSAFLDGYLHQMLLHRCEELLGGQSWFW